MSDSQIRYGMKRTVPLSLAKAEERVRETLKEEGFGILTEIDLQATLKEKIGAEVRPYRILGACSPPVAHQAVSQELDIGLLLPCNVVVYEADSPERSVVAMLEPTVQLAVTGRADIEPLARDVKDRMARALAAI